MRVRIYATLRPLVGGKAVDIPTPPGTTVRDLIDALVTTYPALRPELLEPDGSLFRHVHVFINGRDAPFLPDGLATVLKESDTCDVFPPVAGGAPAPIGGAA